MEFHRDPQEPIGSNLARQTGSRKTGHSNRALKQGTQTGHSNRTLKQDTQTGHSNRTLKRNTETGHSNRSGLPGNPPAGGGDFSNIARGHWDSMEMLWNSMESGTAMVYLMDFEGIPRIPGIPRNLHRNPPPQGSVDIPNLGPWAVCP